MGKTKFSRSIMIILVFFVACTVANLLSLYGGNQKIVVEIGLIVIALVIVTYLFVKREPVGEYSFEGELIKIYENYAKVNGIIDARTLQHVFVGFEEMLPENILMVTLLFDNEKKQIHLLYHQAPSEIDSSLRTKRARVDVIAYDEIEEVRLIANNETLPVEAGQFPLRQLLTKEKTPLTKGIKSIGIMIKTAGKCYMVHMFHMKAKFPLRHNVLLSAVHNTDKYYNAICEVMQSGKSSVQLLGDLPLRTIFVFQSEWLPSPQYVGL